jgi:Hemerythrin HHE cation binding domain/Polyketide cyclase / dehydrase and lipid transport
MHRTDPNGQADTRLMGIIHTALRRDLGRTRTALTASPPPAPPQREAIAGHVGWMMQFLHQHHTTEDSGLYPMVRERNPGAAAVLDRMHADHEAIAGGIDAVAARAAEYGRGGDDGERRRLLAAIDDLEAPLLPHLRLEEDEAMPIVAATLTDAELRRWDEEDNIKPKSISQLAGEAHWILDGLGDEDRYFVRHLVPAVPRFVLQHGFARRYRRLRAACWGAPARRVQKSGRVEVAVPAGRAAVWEIVRDVTRVGEWSHECVGAEWVDGATAAVPGARFRGRNRSGLFRWGRVCEIVVAGPYELTWRTVSTVRFPDSTEWTIRLHEDEGGTRIEQAFRVVKAPRVLDVIYATAIPDHRDRSEALAGDLRRLGALAGDEAGDGAGDGAEAEPVAAGR